MIDSAAKKGQQAVTQLLTRGQLALQRTDDWRRRTVEGLHVVRDGEDPEQPYEVQEERSEAEQAALKAVNSYHDRLTRAIREFERQATTITSIIGTTTPQSSEADTPAQVAMEGWCRSCWRNGQHLQPIAHRPDGKPKYRDLCNGCGEWAASHGGAHPPMEILQIRHTGRRVTRADYERIMGRKPA